MNLRPLLLLPLLPLLFAAGPRFEPNLWQRIPSSDGTLNCSAQPNKVQVTATGTIEYCDASGYSRAITPSSTEPMAVCGDGIITDPEICDVGKELACATYSIGCDLASCAACSGILATCGNAVIERGEECDKTAVPTGCTTGLTCDANCACQSVTPPEPYCGNGYIEGSERCDPGGKACSGQTDCGISGTCTTNVCQPALGLCTSGCNGDCTCATASGTCTGDFYVRTDGSDSNTGTADTAGGAFRTIQKALSDATVSSFLSSHTTTTICVQGPGPYYERLDPSVTPSSAHRLVLQTTTGAIIDPSTAITGWTQSTQARFTNPYVYQKSVTISGTVNSTVYSGEPRVLFVDDKYVPIIDPKEMAYGDPPTEFAGWLNSGPWGGDGAYNGPTRTASWTLTDKVFGSENGITYLSFQSSDSPANHSVRGVEDYGATFYTNGKSYITVAGFTFKNSFVHVKLEGASSFITLRGNNFFSCDECVYGGSSANGNNIVIDGNTFDLKLHLKSGITMSAAHANHWRVWQWFKYGRNRAGNADRSAVYVNSLGSMQFINNTVNNMFQGIIAGQSTNVLVASNTFTNLTDEAVDYQGSACAGGIIRDNEVQNANFGFRMTCSAGPLEVYRNRVYLAPFSDTRAEGGFLYLKGGTTGTQYIYHNSANTRYCVVTGGDYPATGLANTKLVNNICSSASSLVAYDSTLRLSGTNILYNWFSYTPNASYYVGSLGSGNRIKGARYWPTSTIAWTLANPDVANGPRDAAVNITGGSYATWAYLPDPTGVYDTSSPDMGAVQYVSQGSTTTTTSTTIFGTTTSTTLAAPSWAPSIDSLLKFDSPALTEDSGGASPLCVWDNTAGGDLTRDTANYVQGPSAASALTTSSSDMGNGSVCAALGYTSSMAVGLWLNPITGTFLQNNDPIISRTNGNAGYRMLWNPQTQKISFRVGYAAGYCLATTTTSLNPAGVWHMAVGAYDATAQTISIFVDGNRVNVDCSSACNSTDQPSCSWTNGLADSAGIARVGSDSTNFITANVDEVFFDSYSGTSSADGKMDPQAICHMCACGADGLASQGGVVCTCAGDNSWLTRGRWDEGKCGGCTLPSDCNQSIP